MFEKFARSTRMVVEQAQEEARALGSPIIEAEHLLLALASGDTPIANALADCHLDREAVIAALDDEQAAALEVAGVSIADHGPPPPVRVTGRMSFGTSAKRALEQTLRVALERGDKHLQPAHLLLALLLAQHGTVPRALTQASVDRRLLADRAVATL